MFRVNWNLKCTIQLWLQTRITPEYPFPLIADKKNDGKITVPRLIPLIFNSYIKCKLFTKTVQKHVRATSEDVLYSEALMMGKPWMGGGGSSRVSELWLVKWVEVNGVYENDGPGRFNGMGGLEWEGPYYFVPSNKMNAFRRRWLEVIGKHSGDRWKDTCTCSSHTEKISMVASAQTVLCSLSGCFWWCVMINCHSFSVL